MLMGCTSDAGKSLLTTALCRYFADQSFRVAPFKAQNMSTNAAVTPDGGEIGRAQYVQALAARTPPDVRMNPVLLKPKADTHSQAIVMGRYDPTTTALPWLERRSRLWPVVKDALHSLIAEFDQVVIEGAGSPAEVNLRATDIVNMSVALECGADVYLIADIDRGGAFAHLLGTWEFLEPGERALIRGFVLNKFRGDKALLGNATEVLRQRTGIPTVAIVPMRRHALPEEDAFRYRGEPLPGRINIALLVFPFASNLDEFDSIIHAPGVAVTPVGASASLAGYDAIIVPGSTNTVASLAHLRAEGLADEIVRAADTGTTVLGVCGGLQMLGRELHDPTGLEGADMAGLGLLDVTTTMAPDKITRRRSIPWGDATIDGYEIHHGRTEPGSQAEQWLADGLGWRQRNVLGVYAHGLLDNAPFQQWFLDRLGWHGRAADWTQMVEAAIDDVASLVTESGWALRLRQQAATVPAESVLGSSR
jgi:adenosylcobyric acid synthase